MNKTLKFTLIATIVAVGVFIAFHLLIWIVLGTILEVVKIFLIFAL